MLDPEPRKKGRAAKHGCECGEKGENFEIIMVNGNWQCTDCHRKNTMFQSDKRKNIAQRSTRRKPDERKRKSPFAQNFIDFDMAPTVGIGESLNHLAKMLANI